MRLYRDHGSVCDHGRLFKKIDEKSEKEIGYLSAFGISEVPKAHKHIFEEMAMMVRRLFLCLKWKALRAIVHFCWR